MNYDIDHADFSPSLADLVLGELKDRLFSTLGPLVPVMGQRTHSASWLPLWLLLLMYRADLCRGERCRPTQVTPAGPPGASLSSRVCSAQIHPSDGSTGILMFTSGLFDGRWRCPCSASIQPSDFVQNVTALRPGVYQDARAHRRPDPDLQKVGKTQLALPGARCPIDILFPESPPGPSRPPGPSSDISYADRRGLMPRRSPPKWRFRDSLEGSLLSQRVHLRHHQYRHDHHRQSGLVSSLDLPMVNNDHRLHRLETHRVFSTTR